MSREPHLQLLDNQDYLYSQALYIARNGDQALDLLQETNLRICAKISTYVEGKGFKGWAFRIMKNIFNDSCRKVNRVTFPERIENMHTDTPELICIAGEIERVFEKHGGPALKLRALGYDYQDISEELGKPIGTIKAEIHRNRKKIEKLLL